MMQGMAMRDGDDDLCPTCGRRDDGDDPCECLIGPDASSEISTIRSPEVRGVANTGRHTRQGAGPNQGAREG